MPNLEFFRLNELLDEKTRAWTYTPEFFRLNELLDEKTRAWTHTLEFFRQSVLLDEKSRAWTYHHEFFRLNELLDEKTRAWTYHLEFFRLNVWHRVFSMIRGRFIYFIRLILILASTRKLDDLAREHETTRRSGLRARENSMIWLVSTIKLDDLAREHENTRSGRWAWEARWSGKWPRENSIVKRCNQNAIKTLSKRNNYPSKAP